MKTAFPTLADARVTQVFGNYNPALYGGDRKHKGIDYGIMPNNPVYACMPGIVQVAVNGQTGYGRHVRILHPDGSLSVYGHLNKLLVEKGQSVEAGQEIGKSGGDPKDGVDGDGLSTGPHLHWEIRPPGLHASDQTAVDPMDYCLRYINSQKQNAEVTAAAGLNVRSAPSASARQIGTLFRKEVVQVVEQREGWARLHSLRAEWVSAKYLYVTGAVVDTPVIENVSVPELSLEEMVGRLWAAHPELHKGA
jgi:murein DD-endopeptidase MepM/ murein hydrolase activator NlpD